MNYKYIPDSYNYNLIKEKFENYEQFVKVQSEYKMQFEKLFSKYLNINSIDKCIQEQEVDIPLIPDKDYNFYHKFSGLNSKYIFIRNNYHVEKLDSTEISRILHGEQLDMKFFNKTLANVIFEDGDYSFFGIPMDSTKAKSKSIVFEFAYNQLECESIEQLNKITKTIESCFKTIKNSIAKVSNIESSYLVYQCIPNLFDDNRDKFKSEFDKI